MHGEATELNALALDEFFRIDLESMALEEGPGRKTCLGENARDSDGAQCGLHEEVEPGGDAAPGEGGVGVQKVEMAVVLVGSEARENAVLLGDDGAERGEPLLPARNILREGSPGCKLLRIVIRHG